MFESRHDGHASGAQSSRSSTVRHHRVHDRRPPRPADHLAAHALLPARRSLHRRDDRARLPQEGQGRAPPTRRSRCSSPTPRAAVWRTRRRCSCRAPRDVDDRDLDANRDALPARERREAARRREPDAAAVLRPLRLAGTSRASTCTCARSASTCGPTATWPSSRSCSTRTWRRSARATSRSRPMSTPPPRAAAWPGTSAWSELGARYPNAVVSLVAPDGFPFSVRLPIELDREARRVRLGGAPVGVPWQPGLACLTAHDHDAGLQVAAQLPGARRPRGGGRRLGADPAQARRRLRAAAQLAAGPRASQR